MNRDETKKIILMMCSLYPNWKPQDLSYTVDAWTVMLDGYTYQDISKALKAFVLSDESGFAPSVGQLVGMIDKLGNGQEFGEMEAWGLVSKALRRSSYYAQEEFDKLPSSVQQAVGSPTMLQAWAQSDIKSIESVVQSNFLRAYRQVQANERERRKLSAELGNSIGIETDDFIQIRG